jgi:hypothetical protein
MGRNRIWNRVQPLWLVFPAYFELNLWGGGGDVCRFLCVTDDRHRLAELHKSILGILTGKSVNRRNCSASTGDQGSAYFEPWAVDFLNHESKTPTIIRTNINALNKVWSCNWCIRARIQTHNLCTGAVQYWNSFTPSYCKKELNGEIRFLCSVVSCLGVWSQHGSKPPFIRLHFGRAAYKQNTSFVLY